MSNFVSAGRLKRAYKCTASLVLPRFSDEGRASPSRDFGTSCHRWKETGELASGLSPKQRVRLSGINRELLWPAPGRHEVAYAYCVVKKQVYELGAGEDATKAISNRNEYPDSWAMAIVDYVNPELDWVSDLKTGKSGANWEQLEMAAAVYAELEHKKEVTASTTFLPMSPQSVAPYNEHRVYGADELSEGLAKLTRLYGEVLVSREQHKAGTLEAVPGEHCRFCECRPGCAVGLTVDLSWKGGV